MSDNWILRVPNDTRFQPTSENAARARELLASFVPQAHEVKARFEDKVVFFDPGGNWSGVECPTCGRDAESWGSDAVQAASDADFQSLDVITACCGVRVSLNDLRYVWPAGFGRFALEAMSPQVRNVAPDQL